MYFKSDILRTTHVTHVCIVRNKVQILTIVYCSYFKYKIMKILHLFSSTIIKNEGIRQIVGDEIN